MQLQVSLFNTSSNLPLYAADALGCFAHQDLEVNFATTPNSDAQRSGLARGDIHIAHAAVDNAIAMRERSGADVVILAGGDAGMNDFMVRDEISGFEALRGKVLAVDAPNTAYALVAKKILKDRGLLEGRDYSVRAAGGTGPRAAAMVADTQLAMGMVNPPFSFVVQRQGLRSLGTQHDLLGPYQATGAFALRPWVDGHADTVQRYLAALIEGHRAVLDPVRTDAMLDLLKKRFALEGDVAQQTLRVLRTPRAGLAVDARIDEEGLVQVLRIRAELEGMWNGATPVPGPYLWLNHWHHAQTLARDSKSI
jgi:ABC-type nitrate/sulfonate/bicarbonate transport system substrate-binding protein